MKNKIKPILFGTPMVQAILEGRKTQTRRILKPQPNAWVSKIPYKSTTKKPSKNESVWAEDDGSKYEPIKSKYQIGDILWVRETTRIGAWDIEDGKMAFDYKASPELNKTPWCEIKNEDWFETEVIKIADELHEKGIKPDMHGDYTWEPGKSPLKWKPSIFMPKAACRIFLEVTDVRVERLLDISEDDSISEGIYFHTLPIADTGDYVSYPKNYLISEKEADGWPYFKEEESIKSFKSLWESINGKDSWKANPWVWVYDFKVIDKPSNF